MIFFWSLKSHCFCLLVWSCSIFSFSVFIMSFALDVEYSLHSNGRFDINHFCWVVNWAQFILDWGEDSSLVRVIPMYFCLGIWFWIYFGNWWMDLIMEILFCSCGIYFDWSLGIMDPATHGHAKAGWPARTYIQQLCEDTGCCPEDLPGVMNNREKWRERVRDIRATSTTWWWFM